MSEYMPDDFDFPEFWTEDEDQQDERKFGEDEGDNICPSCGSTGEVDGRVCKECQGKGYLNP